MRSAQRRRGQIKIHDILLVTTVVLGGCAIVRADFPVANPDVSSDAVSICVFAANGIVEGQTARVAASYKTDKSHYAYLVNEGCGKSGVLNVGDMEPILEETVRNFYDAGDQWCAKNGTQYLCVIEAEIDADIKIIRSQDGKLAAELLKVHAFSFIVPGS